MLALGLWVMQVLLYFTHAIFKEEDVAEVLVDGEAEDVAEVLVEGVAEAAGVAVDEEARRRQQKQLGKATEARQ